jgi:hypothetical protein
MNEQGSDKGSSEPLVSFGHYIVCASIYGRLLSLWYLQTFLMNKLYIHLVLLQSSL